MHLLKLKDDGEFSLADEYIGSMAIPPYAILSHTWGAAPDEVTFKDLTEGLGKSKAGYEKLAFCAKQAMDDGLEFFWVDTCCIDKSSSAELSESIISMFRWYRDSAKCYVYLSDVSTSGFANHDPSFQKSRWFTRGWTLQELLAPTCVEFFSKSGDRLGNKSSLLKEIAGITGISVQALKGSPLHSFSVEERLSWVENRKTTRDEDMAYALLGIFDISMQAQYGEGKERAWNRLKREINEPLTSERTRPFLFLAVNVVETEPDEELEGNDSDEELEGSDSDEEPEGNDLGEDSWKDIMRSRKKKKSCFNCGSKEHWEGYCSQDCGRCKTFISLL
jgi:hypothetical protein